MGYITNDPCTLAKDLSPESPLSSSCNIKPYPTLLTPAPPLSSGNEEPINPSSPSCVAISFGNVPFS